MENREQEGRKREKRRKWKLSWVVMIGKLSENWRSKRKEREEVD